MNVFFDLQINGYAGVDFNSASLSINDLRNACARLQEDGVEGILLTLITDAVASLRAKIANVVQMREQDPLIKSMVRGLHIEGPFISPVPGFVGAHPAVHAQPATLQNMDILLEAGQGLIQLVTLAPEMDPGLQVVRYLSETGVIVSAGHTDASRDQLQAAIDSGLVMFTHLGNGCPMLMNRHDNIISRVLSLADQLWISFIADGAHIPFFVLQNYLRITGLQRVVIVTDAIAAAAARPGEYQIGNQTVLVGEDGVPRSETGTHLVGSGTTMQQMAERLHTELQFTVAQIELVTAQNPRKLLEQIYSQPASVITDGIPTEKIKIPVD